MSHSTCPCRVRTVEPLRPLFWHSVNRRGNLTEVEELRVSATVEKKGAKYRTSRLARALSSLRDRCAGGFELFRQLPEVSLRRGVSRFMQNGTQLPRELASNAVRPSTLYAITRARFVPRQAPRCQPLPPADFFLRVGTRESSIGPGRAPLRLAIRTHPSTISNQLHRDTAFTERAFPPRSSSTTEFLRGKYVRTAITRFGVDRHRQGGAGEIRRDAIRNSRNVRGDGRSRNVRRVSE